MAERRTPLLDETERGRVLVRERVRVAEPPGPSCHALAFPWASSLAIGWGAPDRVHPLPRVPAAARRGPGRERGRS